MKHNKLVSPFFIIIFFLSFFSKCLILNEKKQFIVRNLDENTGTGDENTGTGDENTGTGDGNTGTGGTPTNQNNNEEKNKEKYDECQVTIASEPTDCFDIEFDFINSNKKCCFLEYKDKKYDNKRKRNCRLLKEEEFLDIKKAIKNIQDNNKNITVLSLECDKSNILSLNNVLLLILLLFPL